MIIFNLLSLLVLFSGFSLQASEQKKIALLFFLEKNLTQPHFWETILKEDSPINRTLIKLTIEQGYLFARKFSATFPELLLHQIIQKTLTVNGLPIYEESAQ